ncbi:MAG: carbohydrate kinase [Proteobacteria bacterium]|nr:carbohydrate kinase [Pseudomonadota bacterium]
MILCCGEALIDFLPRQGPDGATVYQPFGGGSVYNTAIALGRLAVPTGLFCGLSTDFFGDQLRQSLSDSGVVLKFTRTKPHHTTLAFVKLENGQARYSFIDDASAGRNLTKADLPKLPAAVAALHFGSISLIPEPCGGTYEALMKREMKKRVISLDPNIRPTVIKNRKAHLARLARLIALSDIVKVSDEDVHWMTGKTDLAATARKWLKAGAKVVSITRGAEGVEIFTAQHHLALRPPPVTVVDTVGAGDTFNAGFLASLRQQGILAKKAIATISEDQLRAAANYAMKAAAITVSRAGADPPWFKEMV